MTQRYLLDTNTVSQLIRRHPQVTERLLCVPVHRVCISAITAGELAFGLARRPEALALKAAVKAFSEGVEVLPWDEAVAQTYGRLRADLQRNGKTLAPLDLQIAAHALHVNATLISSDKAFMKISYLKSEDWTT